MVHVEALSDARQCNENLNNTVSLIVNGEQATLARRFDCQIPFFYALLNAQLWWSSHYSALVRRLKPDGIVPSVNRSCLDDYLAYQAPLTTHTLFDPIRLLRVGESRTLSANHGQLKHVVFEAKSDVGPRSTADFEKNLVQQIELLDPAITVFHANSGLDSSLTIVNGKGPDDCLGGYASHASAFSATSAHQQRATVTPTALRQELFKNTSGVTGAFWQNRHHSLSLSERLHYDARALTDSWNVIHHAIAAQYSQPIHGARHTHGVVCP